MTAGEIRVAGDDALRARLIAIKAQPHGSWKELDALEREASTIRMELLARQRLARQA